MTNRIYLENLLNTKLFCGANEDVLSDVLGLDGCYARKYRSGEQIDIKDKIAYIAEGSVLVYSADDKRNLLLRKIEKNEIFGVAGLFAPEKKISRCFAKGSTTVLFFESDIVRKLLENDNTVMYNYISFLSGRIGYLNKKITYLTAGSAERKLAVYLAGFESETVSLGTSYSALSDMLDIGRASLYRALDRFEEDGCINRDGNNITIVNKA